MGAKTLEKLIKEIRSRGRKLKKEEADRQEAKIRKGMLECLILRCENCGAFIEFGVIPGERIVLVIVQPHHCH